MWLHRTARSNSCTAGASTTRSTAHQIQHSARASRKGLHHQAALRVGGVRCPESFLPLRVRSNFSMQTIDASRPAAPSARNAAADYAPPTWTLARSATDRSWGPRRRLLLPLWLPPPSAPSISSLMVPWDWTTGSEGTCWGEDIGAWCGAGVDVGVAAGAGVDTAPPFTGVIRCADPTELRRAFGRTDPEAPAHGEASKSAEMSTSGVGKGCGV
mmetsp:Transcript_116633/g.330503  ORF Transcript_116633/g.330503 Transcript_116633/m.330503 type:complete len:214 (+) Transcript_116633:131-772(+)